jgi:hypothetical protein
MSNQLTLPGTVPQQPIWYGYKGGDWYICIEHNEAWWVTRVGWDVPIGPYTKEHACEEANKRASDSAR